MLGVLLEQERGGKTTRECIAERVIAMALAGDLEAVKWIVDRTDGKLKDTAEHTGEVIVRVLRDRAA